MIYHYYELPKTLRKFRVRPVGDLQIGEAGFRQDMWDKWKKETWADKDSYIIGIGDYSDKFRGTVDKKIRHALLEDESAFSQFDDIMRKETQNMAEELKPFKNRIIGLHLGHHKHTFMDGTNDVQYLCQLLKVKYLDFVAGIRISFGHSKVDIYSTHGCGGAKHTHTDLSKLEREIMPFWDCDIFLRGHSTRVYCVNGPPLTKFSASESKTIRPLTRHRLLANTGGFMDAYIPDNPSNYVECFGLPKVALGWCVIEIQDAHDFRESGTLNGRTENPLRINGWTELG